MAADSAIRLSQLAEWIKDSVHHRFARPIWIKAEIAKLNYYPKSGHVYPELVEKENGKTRAQMRGIIWSDTYQRISVAFEQSTGERLREGMEALLEVFVKFHPQYGLHLQIQQVDPEFALGKLAAEKKETEKRLKAEGLWNLNRSLPLTYPPLRIALVSDETSKGYQDFMRITAPVFQYFHAKARLFPANLQGEKALETIPAQLHRIGLRKDEFDIAFILRGGGDDVGLHVYDTFPLASAIALCPVPVWTGIGHATHFTCSDQVAHSHFITPTDAANTWVHKIVGCLEELYELSQRLEEELDFRLETELHFQQACSAHLSLAVNQRIQQAEKYLTHQVTTLQKRVELNLQEARIALENAPEILLRNGISGVRNRQEKLFRLETTWQREPLKRIGTMLERLHKTDAYIRMADPERLLQKGYLLAVKDGKIQTDLSELAVGEQLTLKSATHIFTTEILKKEDYGKSEEQ